MKIMRIKRTIDPWFEEIKILVSREVSTWESVHRLYKLCAWNFVLYFLNTGEMLVIRIRVSRMVCSSSKSLNQWKLKNLLGTFFTTK